MPQLTTFVVCEKLEKIRYGGQDTMQITKPMVAPRIYRVPTVVSFDVAFGLVGIDTTVANQIGTTFLSPEGQAVYASIGEYHASPNAGKVPKEYRAMMGFANLWDIEIPEEGIYHFQVNCNDEIVGSIPIPIFLDWTVWVPARKRVLGS